MAAGASAARLFVGPVVQLLRTCALPFVRRTSTDEFKMLGAISSLVGAVGQAFRPGVPVEVQLEAARMLAAFASVQGQRPVVLSLAAEADLGGAGREGPARQFHTNQNLLTRSGVLEATVRGLRAVTRRAAGGAGGSSDTRELQLALVDTLLQASYSPDNARQVVRAGALAPLTEVLRGKASGSPHAFRDEGVAPTTELLWNLFEAVPEAKALEPAAKDTDYIREGLGRPYKALRDLMAESLLSILGEFLCKGYRAQDKELRNEVLLIIMLLVEEPVNHPAFVEAGLLELALDVAVMPELRAESARVKPFVLTKETDDHEAKLLVWHVMAKLCRGGSEGAGARGGDRGREAGGSGAQERASAASLQKAIDGGFWDVLLMYVDVHKHMDSSKPKGGTWLAIRRWSDEELISLQKQAIATLHKLAPLDVMAFAEAKGPDILVECLKSLIDSSHSQSLLLPLIQTLISLSSLPKLQERFGEIGAIEAASSILSDPSIGDVVREDAATWISMLCKANAGNQARFRECNGVDRLVSQVHDLRELDPTLPSPRAMSVLNAVWTCVVPNDANLHRFLALDGVESLLDLLDFGNCYMHGVTLSILSDISESEFSHTFFDEWISSKNNCSAAHLLLELWRREEDTRQMCRDGVISNIARPFSGTGKSKPPLDAPESIYNFSDQKRVADMERIKNSVSGDAMFMKIYSIFKLLGFERFECLTGRNGTTLCLVKEYVRFRQGEVWQDIQGAFSESGLQPTENDAQRVESGIEHARQLAAEVREKQTGVLADEAEALRSEERQFYANMIDQRKHEREAKAYKKDRSSLTMKERIEAKRKKEEMLKNSFHHYPRAGEGGAPTDDSSGTHGSAGLLSQTGSGDAVAAF